QFPSWSATVFDWLARSLADAERAGVDAGEIRALHAIAESSSALLDEITAPRLLHGDLWTFNMLIKRDTGGPCITPVLDSDRVSWGDPLADWTFYRLPRRTSERMQAAFWDEYSRPEATPSTRFRAQVYTGMHLCNVLSEVRRRGRTDLEPAVHSALREIV